MKRLTPTAEELSSAARLLLTTFSPELIDLWKNSPVTGAAFNIIEALRMECIEQAELLPEGDTVTILMAQAQILTRLAEELDTTIVETIEDDADEDPETHDPSPSRPSPRRRAHITS